jgi:chemotaxis protein MotB
MAFFLLMWLLGSTAQGDLEGIADYFQNPLKLADGRAARGTGDSSSIIQGGGGEDLSRKVGQVKPRRHADSTRAINLDAAPGTRQERGRGHVPRRRSPSARSERS